MTSGSHCSVALVHHPVYDKHKKVVATALTNLDLHDIARSSRTYGSSRLLHRPPGGCAARAGAAHRRPLAGRRPASEKNDFRRQAIERILEVASPTGRRRASITPATAPRPWSCATAARDSAAAPVAL